MLWIKFIFDSTGEFIYDEEANQISGQIRNNVIPTKMNLYKLENLEIQELELTDDIKNKALSFLQQTRLVKETMNWDDISIAGLKYEPNNLELVVLWDTIQNYFSV